MSQVPIDLIVTSQLERAKETAQIVLQNHQDSAIPVLEIEDLAEISWGTLEGTPTKGVSDVLEEWRRGSFDGDNFLVVSE
jgi:broad specificity phosphatase PhoE